MNVITIAGRTQENQSVYCIKRRQTAESFGRAKLQALRLNARSWAEAREPWWGRWKPRCSVLITTPSSPTPQRW